jgi:two-component system, NarL family, response regulator LiaR
VSAIRVVVADPRRLLREALAEYLTAERFEVATAGDRCSTVLQAQRIRADVVVMAEVDDALPSLCRQLHELDPPPRTLLIDGPARDDVLLQAVEAGVEGYLVGDGGVSQLVEAIKALTRDESVVPPAMLGALLRGLIKRRREAARASETLDRLTRREREVLGLLVGGLDDERMAERLFISPQTVRTHVQRILQKLEVHSRLEAISLVSRTGLGDQSEAPLEGSVA